MPRNRRYYFCCTGKIDCVSCQMPIERDAGCIDHAGTYGAAEMVIAVSPYGVLKPITSIGGRRPKILLWTGPRHHLAYLCHRRDDRLAPLIKLDPWCAI